MIFLYLFLFLQQQQLQNSFARFLQNKYFTIPKMNIPDETHTHWYVIGEKTEFLSNKLYKKTIWDHDYVIYKTDSDKYIALDNHCSHRGSSLSKGTLIGEKIVCPYHGYEFNTNGTLCLVPGLNFSQSTCQNIQTYQIREKNGWVYLNTRYSLRDPDIPIFDEPEASHSNCTANFLNMPFTAYARLLSENSLDVMHIGFVHSFGNRQVPSPLQEKPPKLQPDYPHHWKSEYIYEAGENSLAKRIFNSSYLNVDNEFILPHTQIVRVKFQKYVNTIITFATPINWTHSHFYMKTYRSYWYKPDPLNIFDDWHNWVGDTLTKQMMMETILQDKEIVENIKPEHMQGKFNMKYDKLANVYRTLYEKIVIPMIAKI